MSEEVMVDTLLTSSNAPISFRHLSSHLQIPTRSAQSLLLSYVSSHPKIQVLWCVTTLSSTSHRRVSLTTNPPQNCVSKKVWAVALPDTQPLWLASDSTAALKLSGAPVTESNSLRDGRFNPIKSDGSVWKAASVDVPQAPAKPQVKSHKPMGGGLLAEVKAKVKARDAKRAASRNMFKPFTSANGGSKGSSFGTKKLGMDAVAKIRAAEQDDKEEPQRQKRSVRRRDGEGKKTRRVIEEESDEEDSDGEKEREALEKEAAERERAEREREELRREVEELSRKHDEEDEEPQSPELRDLDEEVVEKEVEAERKTPEKRTPEKRKLNEAFGLPEVSRPRRIRREVSETVTGENGYLISRIVVKEFDEHGNEIIEEKDPKATTGNEKKSVEKGKSKGMFATPLKPANSQNGKSHSNPKKGKDGKKPSSKLGTSATKKTPKKKIKGNIMSYFKK